MPMMKTFETLATYQRLLMKLAINEPNFRAIDWCPRKGDFNGLHKIRGSLHDKACRNGVGKEQGKELSTIIRLITFKRVSITGRVKN